MTESSSQLSFFSEHPDKAQGALNDGSFPQLRRIVNFLASCGLYSYGLKFFWFAQEHRHNLFYPSPHRPLLKNYTGAFEKSDEAKLQHLQQTSMTACLPVGEVFADAIHFLLDVAHGNYVLSYSLLSSGRQQLICDLLAEKGISEYELILEVNEGRMLPPHPTLGELEDCSGTVVTPLAVYSFWLSRSHEYYTLGEGNEWHEYVPEEIAPHGKFPGSQQEVEGARLRLSLRRPVEGSESQGKTEWWELHEEEVIRRLVE